MDASSDVQLTRQSDGCGGAYNRGLAFTKEGVTFRVLLT